MNDWIKKSHNQHHEKADLSKKTLICKDDNIDKIRERFPDGLSFVVGDTHGQRETLIALMNKIKFDPSFGESLVNNSWYGSLNNIDRLLKASPSMKIITLLNDGNIEIIEKES